jgi:glycosyltransferase involved in cell wall biosynthesis
MVALLVARLSVRRADPPLVVELRDLWAGNPAYDAGGALLTRLEGWVLKGAAAVIVCTPEAEHDLRERHPELANRIRVIPNGYEPELLQRRTPRTTPLIPRVILHSGVLVPGRPLKPLLAALSRDNLRGRFSLVLQGHLSRETLSELRGFENPCEVEVRGPAAWSAAISAIASADVGLVTQAAAVGDPTAVASKAYEYMALGKPVLCLSDGGATEAMLRRIGADQYCARLNDVESIVAALERLDRDLPVEPVPPERLRPFDRALHARDLAVLLHGLSGPREPTQPPGDRLIVA